MYLCVNCVHFGCELRPFRARKLWRVPLYKIERRLDSSSAFFHQIAKLSQGNLLLARKFLPRCHRINIFIKPNKFSIYKVRPPRWTRSSFSPWKFYFWTKSFLNTLWPFIPNQQLTRISSSFSHCWIRWQQCCDQWENEDEICTIVSLCLRSCTSLCHDIFYSVIQFIKFIHSYWLWAIQFQPSHWTKI